MRTFAILAVVIVALLAVANTARAANATTNLHIEGMTCAGATAKPVKAAASATSCDVPVVMPKAAKPVSLAGYRTDELRTEFNRASDRVRFAKGGA